MPSVKYPARMPAVWFSLLAIVLVLSLPACSSKTRPAKFYLLQPITPSEANNKENEIGGPKLIGVGPVEMPAYLDRPQIVTGGGGAEMQLDEFQRWAEPLRDNITHVLAENLSLLLPASHLLPFPWNRSLALDYQVEVQITRFHVDAGGICELKANWSILRQNKPLLMKEFRGKTKLAGEDYGSKVAAQSRALADFSKTIAEGLGESSLGR